MISGIVLSANHKGTAKDFCTRFPQLYSEVRRVEMTRQVIRKGDLPFRTFILE